VSAQVLRNVVQVQGLGFRVEGLGFWTCKVLKFAIEGLGGITFKWLKVSVEGVLRVNPDSAGIMVGSAPVGTRDLSAGHAKLSRSLPAPLTDIRSFESARAVSQGEMKGWKMFLTCDG
jgi:hypothetical protein